MFIRTTLEDYFKQIESSDSHLELGSREDNQFVFNELKKLLEKLQDTVINSSYLRSLIENASKHPSLKALARKEEPLMFYYDSLVKTIERLLKDLNYIDLINRYDNAKIGLDKEKREIMIKMYKISSTLIDNLKKAAYKINTNRKKLKKK